MKKEPNKRIKRLVALILSAFLIFSVSSANALPVCAAPAADFKWYLGVPKFHSNEGCLKYISEHGMESYTTKDTFNLEQFLIDNPDLVAASITDRDAVWNWIVTFDSVSPRIIHSMDAEEEYYCRARNLCIQLGVYAPTSAKTVKEKCKAIHDEVCRRCYYDDSFSKYTYKEIMDQNIGVCNAFATYGCLMFTIAGVENGFVAGPNHIWNAVLAEDGNWYQIDMTWDACNYNNYHMGEIALDVFFWITDRSSFTEKRVYENDYSYWIVKNVSASGVAMAPTSQDMFITQDLR